MFEKIKELKKCENFFKTWYAFCKFLVPLQFDQQKECWVSANRVLRAQQDLGKLLISTQRSMSSWITILMDTQKQMILKVLLPNICINKKTAFHIQNFQIKNVKIRKNHQIKSTYKLHRSLMKNLLNHQIIF